METHFLAASRLLCYGTHARQTMNTATALPPQCAGLQLLHSIARMRIRQSLWLRKSPTLLLDSTRRHLSLSPALRASRSSKHSVSTPSRVPPPPVLPNTTAKPPKPGDYSLAKDLASRSIERTLYVGTESNTYPIACLGLSGFCISYGIYHFVDMFLLPHTGLAWFVNYAYGFVCVFVIGLGVWAGRSATHLVKSLRAVPVRSGSGSGPGSRGLMLRIEKRRLMPFFGSQFKDVPLDDAVLSVPVHEALRGAELLGQTAPTTETGRRRVEELRSREQRGQDPVGKAYPVRREGFVTRNVNKLLLGLRRIVTREGFVSLYVGKEVWRIDAGEGTFPDGGMAMERLLRQR